MICVHTLDGGWDGDTMGNGDRTENEGWYLVAIYERNSLTVTTEI